MNVFLVCDYGDVCHGLTFECQCDLSNSLELPRRLKLCHRKDRARQECQRRDQVCRLYTGGTSGLWFYKEVCIILE